MYQIDYHTHSSCSPDGSYPMTRMAQAGIAAGLRELCFTDHCDLLDHKGGFHFDYDWAPVREQFAAAKTLCGEKLTLRFGLELGEAPENFKAADTIIQNAPELDFVICSIHNLGSAYHGGQEFYFDQYRDRPERCYEQLDVYFPKLLSCARWGNFETLGHITYPLRYMRDRDGQAVDLGRYHEQIDALLRALAETGRALELNVNRGGYISDQLPIFRQFLARGGEFVTIGSDAHRPEHVGAGISAGYELLREAGFRYVTCFEGRKPHQLKL